MSLNGLVPPEKGVLDGIVAATTPGGLGPKAAVPNRLPPS